VGPGQDPACAPGIGAFIAGSSVNLMAAALLRAIDGRTGDMR
jgi:hypothetical protein